MKFIRIILFCLVFPTVAFAHGDEDHSQGGAKGASSAASLQPRIETATETFELVGQLHEDQLALFIDRFETNEPVLNASVEIEASGAKAQAKFRADRGDYLVDDEALLTALAKPGKHSLVFTIAAGADSDLLEGTMQVDGDVHAGSHSGTGRISTRTSILLAALLAGAIAVGVALAIRRKNANRS